MSSLTSLLLIAVLCSAAPSAASAGAASLEASNLIGNPGFEVDTAGWEPGSSTTSLTRVAGGHSGSFAAQLSNSSAGAQCSLEDDPSWVAVTQSGPYTISIWVRSDAAGRSFKLRIREYSGGSQVGSTSSTVSMTSTWQQVKVVYTPAAPGQSRLDFQGYTSSTPVGVCFEADDASASVGETTNGQPVAVGNSATTALNTAVTINVLANDSDPDNDPLTVTGTTTPAHGAAVVNANNTITYTPATGYTGPDSFTYSISDGRGGTASATVSITVSPRRQPTAGGGRQLGHHGTRTPPLTINVLANDSDPDNDPLTVTGTTTPAHGTAVVNANNTITYTPATSYTGPDSFTYSISDGRGGTASATVSITVSPAGNNAPYDIAVFGDVPYSSSAITKYVRMIDNINAGTPLFSVHVGDIGPGSSATCTNATVDRETARFDTFTRPLMYTPGDNEWTDCGSARLARLSYIRSTVFRGTGTRSRGRTTMTLESQGASGYPENARWRQGPVTYATLHMVGGKDNYSNRSEHDPRRAATITWLRQTFAQAKARGDKGVVLLAQVDPKFSDPTSSAYRTHARGGARGDVELRRPGAVRPRRRARLHQ